MECYVGLDVSLKQTAICIVDRTGKVQREGIVSSDPEAIAAFIKSYAPNVVRIASSLNKRTASKGAVAIEPRAIFGTKSRGSRFLSVSCAAEAIRVCLSRAVRAPYETLPVCAT